MIWLAGVAVVSLIIVVIELLQIAVISDDTRDRIIEIEKHSKTIFSASMMIETNAADNRAFVNEACRHAARSAASMESLQRELHAALNEWWAQREKAEK